MLEQEIRRLLQMHWGLDPHRVVPLPGGMNSETWDVQDGASRWVAKSVTTANYVGFAAGLRAALIVQAGGIPAGAPVPTRSGALSVEAPGGHLALLRWVAGRQLVGAGGEVTLIGATLAAAHALLLAAHSPADTDFEVLDVEASHLDVEPWVRPAVTQALREWQDVRSDIATWGLLHGDPAPEAFIAPAAGGACGLIDGADSRNGPCLFDVASAVMYVGPEAAGALITAYLSVGVMDRAEVDVGLQPTLGLRWAVQASYFAGRLATNDMTGIAEAQENHKGLEDARRYLERD